MNRALHLPAIRRGLLTLVVCLVVVAGSAPAVQAGLLSISNPDSYSTPYQTKLVVPAPGVLDNDIDVNPSSAQLVSGVSNGSLTFRSDGGFTYTPDNGFSGTNSFRYRASASLLGLLPRRG